MKDVQVLVRMKCKTCNGNGKSPVTFEARGSFTSLRCGTCKGEGWIQTWESLAYLLKEVQL